MTQLSQNTEDIIDLKKCIVELEQHAETSNKEVGIMQKDISVIQADIVWIKDTVKEVKSQTWWILTTIVIGFLVSIYLKS